MEEINPNIGGNPEDGELEQAFEQITAAANGNAEPRKSNKTMRICLTVTAVILLAAIIIGTCWFLNYTADDGLIYDNVSVMDIDLSGMTPEEAAQALSDAFESEYGDADLAIQLPDATVVLSHDGVAPTLDVDALVEDAFNYGRGGNRWENTKAKEAAQLTSFTLDATDYLTLNEAYIQQMVGQLAENAYSELTQPQVVVEGTVPELKLEYEDALALTDVVHMTITVTTGTPARNLDSSALAAAIKNAYLTGNFDAIQMDYAVVEPEAVDLTEAHTQYTIAPVDSTLDTSTWKATQETLGYTFDLEALQAQVDAAGYGETITASFQFTPAEVTKAKLEANLFKDVLGEAHTSHTNNSNRNTNLKLACAAINGTVLMPGDTFSFNGVVGQRTEAKGYKAAGAYVGGQNVETIGGGICQVSSSLYYAVLQADLKVVTRYNHGYVVTYLPYGMDATVSWGSLDFKFKNNTDYPIKIQASVSGGKVHIKLIGTDTKDYYVKTTYEIVDGPYEGATKYKVYAANNSEGYKDGEVIQTAYTGVTVKTYSLKYSKDTGKLISKDLVNTSTYKKRDKIICIIGDPNAPTDENGKPIATTTKPTTESTTETTTAPTTEATTETTAPPSETTVPPSESTSGED